MVTKWSLLGQLWGLQLLPLDLGSGVAATFWRRLWHVLGLVGFELRVSKDQVTLLSIVWLAVLNNSPQEVSWNPIFIEF